MASTLLFLSSLVVPFLLLIALRLLLGSMAKALAVMFSISLVLSGAMAAAVVHDMRILRNAAGSEQLMLFADGEQVVVGIRVAPGEGIPVMMQEDERRQLSSFLERGIVEKAYGNQLIFVLQLTPLLESIPETLALPSARPPMTLNKTQVRHFLESGRKEEQQFAAALLFNQLFAGGPAGLVTALAEKALVIYPRLYALMIIDMLPQSLLERVVARMPTPAGLMDAAVPGEVGEVQGSAINA